MKQGAPEVVSYDQQDAFMHFVSNARGSIPEAHDINAHELLAFLLLPCAATLHARNTRAIFVSGR